MRAVRTTAVVILGSAALVGAQAGQTSTFQSRVDVVPVYVSVHAGGSIVGGLSARDFALADSTVPQRIESVSSDAVPIDVTLVIDTSSSVINSLTVFRTDVARIAQMLRPDEQMRLITFETGVREILPMQPASARLPLGAINLGSDTSLNDALLFSMARARRPSRRHLVFVFTDGYDTASVLDAGALTEVASRADALLHVVLVKPNVPPDERAAMDIARLGEAATRTGGELYPPSPKDSELVDAFERAIEAFRGSYVLYFTPAGVPRGGWHPLTVELLRPGNFQVRARLGYFGS